MREKYIEQKLVREVKKRGGLCEKWNSGSSGWPDRLVLLPDGKFGLVEVKASGKKPRVLQEHRHDQLRSLGYKVFVLDDAGQIGGFLMEYKPHDYQQFAINYILEHPIAAVILGMGLGKTSITLTAIEQLIYDSFEVSKVLVVAPLRVARNTWSDEIHKWNHLKHLRYSIVLGSAAERKKALEADADIYIINRENLQWLIEQSGVNFSGIW